MKFTAQGHVSVCVAGEIRDKFADLTVEASFVQERPPKKDEIDFMNEFKTSKLKRIY